MKKIALILILMSIYLVGTANQPVTTNLKPTKGTVALTFDDGPNPEYTPQILKILDNYNIKATFFVMGNHAKAYPELLKEIKAHGHNIANHTYTHPILTKLNEAQIYQQLADTSKVIKDITDQAPVCLRPPYGAHNKKVDAIANSLGMKVITWDWNSFDYERRGVKAIEKEVLTHAHSGFVFLMHDGGGNRQQTVDALATIIEGIKAKGLGFDKICG